MRTTFSRRWSSAVIVILTIALAGVSWQALSDDKAAGERVHRVPVALLDVAKVFKNCRSFDAEMSRIKREIEEFESEIRARSEEIARLAPTDAGSAPPSTEATARVAELKAKLQADIAARRNAFLAEEALLYFKVFAQIERSAGQLSKERGIGLVLRHRTDTIDATNRNSILEGVNRAVVCSDVPDLTDEVIAILNRPKQ